MNKEHHAHISEHFNLVRFHLGNSPDYWSEYFEGQMQTFDVRIRNLGKGWDIIDIATKTPLFGNLPSENFAEDILSYIEQTRVLFA